MARMTTHILVLMPRHMDTDSDACQREHPSIQAGSRSMDQLQLDRKSVFRIARFSENIPNDIVLSLNSSEGTGVKSVLHDSLGERWDGRSFVSTTRTYRIHKFKI